MRAAKGISVNLHLKGATGTNALQREWYPCAHTHSTHMQLQALEIGSWHVNGIAEDGSCIQMLNKVTSYSLSMVIKRSDMLLH